MNQTQTGLLDVGHEHQLHWATYGDSRNPAMVLIHGGSGLTFNMPHMTGLYDLPLYIIDVHQRGMGLSQPFGKRDHNTLSDTTNDIEQLRHHLNLDQWSILSWSFGAIFMADYALTYPHRCESLITYAPFLGSQEDYDVLADKKPNVAETYFGAHGTRDARVITKNMYQSAHSDHLDEQLYGYYTAQRVWNNDLTYSDLLASKTPAEWTDVLNTRAISAGMYKDLYSTKDRFLETKAAVTGGIQTPTTLIYGTDDGWSDFNSYTDSLFTSQKRVHVEHAGHNIHEPRVQTVLRREIALIM